MMSKRWPFAAILSLPKLRLVVHYMKTLLGQVDLSNHRMQRDLVRLKTALAFKETKCA